MRGRKKESIWWVVAFHGVYLGESERDKIQGRVLAKSS